MLLRKLTVVMLSLLAALLTGEVVIRNLYPTLGWGLMRDELLGWASYEYLGIDPGTADHTKKKYLFLGDSFLAGAGLRSLDERFSDRFADLMGDSAAVYTFASGGWGTDQQYLALLQKGLALQPDVVVLAYCPLNDLDNITSSSHGGDLRKPYFIIEDGDAVLYGAGGRRLPAEAVRNRTAPASPLLRCYLWNFLRWKLRLLPSAGRAANASPFLPGSAEHLRYREELFLALLRKMRQACEGAGAKLFVLPLPIRGGDMPQVPGDYGGADVIALARAFPGPSDNPVLHREIWPTTDEHFSAVGHGIIAGILHRRFSE